MLKNAWAWLARSRLELAALMLMGLLALGRGIREAPLVDWDEATYAEVVHEAAANGSYLDFTWNGAPYFKKPPILFWTVAASFSAFGESEWAARLPAVLFGLGTLLLAYLVVVPIGGQLGGFFAGAILLSFYFFIARGGRECATDAPLIFFSMLAIFAAIRTGRGRRWLVVAGAACGAAILSKGLAGVIPLTVVAVTAVLAGEGLGRGMIGALVAVVVATAIAAPWFIYETSVNGGIFWTTFLTQETVMRIVSHLEDERQASDYSIRIFANQVHHLWPLVFPLGGILAVAARRGLRRPAWPSREVMVWLLWLALALGAACAVQTKIGWYILPALIPVALLGGAVLGCGLNQTGPLRPYCLGLTLLAIALLAVHAPHKWRMNELTFQMQRDRSEPSYIMGMRARDLAALRGGGELYFAGVPLPTLVYYSRLRCHFVQPSQPALDLVDPADGALHIGYHDLVIRDPGGETFTIANLDDEWQLNTGDAIGPELDTQRWLRRRQLRQHGLASPM